MNVKRCTSVSKPMQLFFGKIIFDNSFSHKDVLHKTISDGETLTTLSDNKNQSKNKF